MKKLLPLFSALFLANILFAEVIYVNTNQIISNCISSSSCQYNLDLNSDSSPDLTIINESNQTSVGYGIFFQSQNNSRVVASSQSGGVFIANTLAESSQIGASSSYASGNTVYIVHPDYTQSVGEDGLYFGVEFFIGDDKHYGWLRADVTQNFSIRLTEFAYETEADKPISVGVKEGAGVIKATSVEVFTTDDKRTISSAEEQINFEAEVLPTNVNDDRVIWAVDPPNLGTFIVNQDDRNKAIFKGNRNGTGLVYAVTTDGSDIRDTFSITISGLNTSTIPVASIQVATADGKPKMIDVDNGSLDLAVFVAPSNATNREYEWSVSDNEIAEILPTGTLRALRNGNVTVEAMAIDGSNVKGSIEIEITNQSDLVLANILSVRGANGRNTIQTQNGTLQLFGNIFPANANVRALDWSLDNEELAEISYNGLVIAKNNGTVKAIANTIDGSNKSDTFEITISNQIEDFVFIGDLSVQAEANTKVTNPGQTVQFYAQFLPLNASIQSVKWGVNVPDSIATIDFTGKLTAKKPGLVTVFAYAVDRSNKIAFRVLTIDNEAISTPIEEFEKPVVSIAPNPFTEFVTIKSSKNIAKVYLYNALGQLIKTTYPMTETKTVTEQIGAGLQTGIHYLVVESRDGSRTSEVLIKQ